MKDYEALSRKHFDHQAAEYDARDTVYYSREGKISCRDIAAQLKAVPHEALLDVACGMCETHINDVIRAARSLAFSSEERHFFQPRVSLN